MTDAQETQVPLGTLLRCYLQQPSPENWNRLRDAAANSPCYSPYSDYRNQALALLSRGEWEQAKGYLLSTIPGLALNPGIHKMLSFALHKLGEQQSAQAEFVLAEALLRGIQSTGDGSEAHPYVVSSVQDEYDLLEHLGKTPRGQALVEKAPRYYDRLDCEDGSQIWFDITQPLTHLRRTSEALRVGQ